MKKNWLLFLLPTLVWATACSDDISDPDPDPDPDPSDVKGRIILVTNIDEKVKTTLLSRSEPDLGAFSVIIEDSEGGRNIVAYPTDNTIGDLTPGEYDVTVTSHPEGFTVPTFEDRAFSGTVRVRVSANTTAQATVTCTQSNSGIKFVYDESLAAAGYDNVIPVITQGGLSLTFDAENRDAAGYFSPGSAILRVFNGTEPILVNGSESLDIALEFTAKQLSTMTLTADVPEPEVLPVWSRPTAQRMNLHGKVKTASYHVSPPRDAYIEDMTFDEQGWLTSYTHTKANMTVVTATVVYDEQGRLSRINAVSSQDNYYITLTYGSHGKYITTEDIFNEFSFVNFNLSYILWMPPMLRDLESVSLFDGGTDTMTMSFEFEHNGNAGIGYRTTGSDSREEFFTYTFDGDYISELTFDTGWYPVNTVYSLDTETGCILESNQGDVAYYFNNDRLNTFASFTSDWVDGEVYEYNENLDIIKRTAGAVITEWDYDYDERGNWHNMFNETAHSFMDRTFTFWD